MSYEPLPKALPKEIVMGIWDEVLPKDDMKELRQPIMDGLVLPKEGLLLEFIQAAMEYPHLATAAELQEVLEMSVVKTHRLMRIVRSRARKQRK